MHKPYAFSDSIYEERIRLAEPELSSFIAVVATLHGREHAKLSVEDWLEESELIDSPPRSKTRNWHAVTIAASARLASRLPAGDTSSIAQHRA